MAAASDRIIRVSIESTAKRSFARAVDWPGWARSAKTEELALRALAGYAGRYAIAAEQAGHRFAPTTYEIVERVAGGSGTDFGVPSAITDLDRRPIDASEAERRVGLVLAAWSVFDSVAAKAPPSLRKGPRGGGRDRDKMIGHVVDADHTYAREIGHRGPPPGHLDRVAIAAERAAVTSLLRRPSDGSPLAGRRWTTRYAAARIAWHALDHAWEMEDRTEPEGAGAGRVSS
jgi:hypothetical protein